MHYVQGAVTSRYDRPMQQKSHQEPRWTMRLSWTKAAELFPNAIISASIMNFGTIRPTIAQTQTLTVALQNGVLTLSDKSGVERRGDAMWDGERWIWMFEVPKNHTWLNLLDTVPPWARHQPFTRI